MMTDDSVHNPWKSISFNDSRFFTLRSSYSGIDKKNLISGDGIYPYVTRSYVANGWSSFVPKQDKPLDPGNVITIGLDTQTVFYQPTAFYTGQNIQVLESPYMTQNVALFLIPLIMKQLQVLNWGGNGATLGRLRKKNLMLPMNENDEPDWQYMSTYVSSIVKKLNVTGALKYLQI